MRQVGSTARRASFVSFFRCLFFFFFSSRRRHTRFDCDWSSDVCSSDLATNQAMRFNLIGTFFNQTLPSSIGGDAVRLWLVARGGAGWRAATYSIFVDRAIGLIALAIIIVASLPWSYRLITHPNGPSALLLVDFAPLPGGVGILGLC